MNVRNPTYLADGRINCEVNQPQRGWEPYTADPNDVELMGRLVYEAALAMKPAPYIPPTAEEALAAEREGMSCSAAQMGLALIEDDHLAAFEAAIADIPPAAMIWEKSARLARRGPILDALATFMTDSEIDDLFRTAAATSV